MLISVPLSAQQERKQRNEAPQRREGQAQQRPRAEAPRPKPAPQQHVQRAQPRREAAPQRTAPQARPREQRRAVGTRGSYAVPRPEYRGRAYVEPRTYGYARPRVAIPVITYPRPYYAFRPHFSLGFGLYLGYPVTYPVAYGYPTYVYGAPVGYNIAPGAYGGASFDVQPDTADVVVDGSLVGIARDFGPLRQPLTLMPGRHHVELQAPGLEPLAFDVDVMAGEVVPFRGTLQAY
jgi:hypothetical protein